MADQIITYNHEHNIKADRKRYDDNMLSMQNLATGVRTPLRGDRKKISISSGFNFAHRQRGDHSLPNSFDYGSEGHPQMYQTHQPQFTHQLDGSYYSNRRGEEYNGWGNHLQDASKTIQKQDEMIYALRSELRKLQDMVNQKDNIINLKNLE